MSDRTPGEATDPSESNGADAGHAVDEPLLARVPEWVVTLGAGSLFTSTLLTLAAAVFAGHAVATSQWYGYQPYQLGLATLQFGFATAFQGAGLYFALKRVRWLWVMLAAAAGILSFIALPFACVSLVCLGLGKYHFALDTPVERLRGDEE